MNMNMQTTGSLAQSEVTTDVSPRIAELSTQGTEEIQVTEENRSVEGSTASTFQRMILENVAAGSGSVATIEDGIPASGEPGLAMSVQVKQAARPYLVGKTREIIEGLRGIIVDAATEPRIKITEIDIGLQYLDRAKKRSPRLWIVVKTTSDVHPNQALALWDAIGLKIERWRARLSPMARQILDHNISISVDWTEPYVH